MSSEYVVVFQALRISVARWATTFTSVALASDAAAVVGFRGGTTLLLNTHDEEPNNYHQERRRNLLGPCNQLREVYRCQYEGASETYSREDRANGRRPGGRTLTTITPHERKAATLQMEIISSTIMLVIPSTAM